MTQSFDEWFDKEYSNYGNLYKKAYDEKHDIYGSQFVDERYDAYKAGAQSRQAEVDSLEKGWVERKNERDELQKRIDKALELLEYNEYEDSTSQAINILKGKEND